MTRKRNYDTLERVADHGAYDEYPVLPPGIDPQLCLSRNSRPQPFFLICEFDTVIAQLSGRGRIELRDAPVLRFTLEPGDFVYIPGGTPHRLVPTTESIIYRYRAEHSGLEGVTWYCQSCGAEIRRDIWDTAEELAQEGYLRATTAFNESTELRSCAACGAVHEPVDCTGVRWAEIVAELRADPDAPRPGPASRPGDEDTRAMVPSDRKEPMKVNAFWFTRVVNTQLAPLFPYVEPGSIVPCVSMHRGGAHGDIGHFVHVNSVDEVFVNFGAVNTYVKPGFARVGTRTHGVGSKTPPPPTDGEMAAINIITQRHPYGLKQDESIVFVCRECNHELLRRDYDGNPSPSEESVHFTPDLPTFATLVNSSFAAQAFNGDGNGVECPECGTVNEPFPLHNWGWAEYLSRTQATILSRRSLVEAVETAVAGARTNVAE